ncbi:MAG: hypothetical protein R3242_03915 [Akkermansiaceae bacterium]|nr:hypothetical protein [Akkermansiaceae bacterium]
MPAGLPAGLDRDLLAGIVNEQQIQDAGSLVWGAMLGALPLAALFGLLFFLLSLVMVGVAHRRRLYHRRHGAWNRLTKLHDPLLMLTLVILGFALGLIQSIQNSANRARCARRPWRLIRTTEHPPGHSSITSRMAREGTVFLRVI